MAKVRTRDTSPELALRSELHRRRLRFRVDRSPLVGLRSRADIVFGPARVAVYVDGCFWHCCPEHRSMPKANKEYWEQKLARNVERDAEVDRRLNENGWQVIRVWEHETAEGAADRVERAVRTRLSSRKSGGRSG
jgi:DNA mismatch endonuclease (patch repair protein)